MTADQYGSRCAIKTASLGVAARERGTNLVVTTRRTFPHREQLNCAGKSTSQPVSTPTCSLDEVVRDAAATVGSPSRRTCRRFDALQEGQLPCWRLVRKAASTTTGASTASAARSSGDGFTITSSADTATAHAARAPGTS